MCVVYLYHGEENRKYVAVEHHRYINCTNHATEKSQCERQSLWEKYVTQITYQNTETEVPSRVTPKYLFRHHVTKLILWTP